MNDYFLTTEITEVHRGIYFFNAFGVKKTSNGFSLYTSVISVVQKNYRSHKNSGSLLHKLGIGFGKGPDRGIQIFSGMRR